ncbi:hypothetical protein PC128_g23559 [Phytophthora cactorum]|nr:hypothetical protein PC120_g22736 [Phytophthora cactorum]KAG3148610.1 hypothetical protein PC128_g23559 [Phytophthora cactorum]KAG4041030.1 hypothetical protein PC123_g23441 [Phytophthora cactorum]
MYVSQTLTIPLQGAASTTQGIKAKGNTPVRLPRGQIAGLGPRYRKLEVSLAIWHNYQTQSEDLPLLLHPIPAPRQGTRSPPQNSLEVTKRADLALPTSTQDEESSADHGSLGDPLR